MASAIWLLVPTFTGAFVSVTQIGVSSEVLDWRRYGLLVNCQEKTSVLLRVRLRFKAGYVCTTETWSNRMALVAAIPFVALTA